MFSIEKQGGKKDSFYYFNESDIQYIVHLILQDAIHTCNILFDKEGSPKELQYRLEANMWSEKPDHAVVRQALWRASGQYRSQETHRQQE